MNQPVDLSRLPTIAHLNRSQKRVFILRDQLKFLDPHHLDTFLDGLSTPEPPNYQFKNSRIYPPLVEVILKAKATKLDLGNVRFREEGQSVIRRVHFTIEAGNCEMRESESLPEEESNLDSVPVDVWLIKNMISLFQAKYEAIDTRKRSLNEIRVFAHNAVKQPKIRVGEGKSLAKLHANDTSVNSVLTNGKLSSKRGPGDPIPKHPANKRKRLGLDCIPNSVKSETFDSIPQQVKVDLFNTMTRTAFPNFDNIMMASWNVVSVYLGVGSEDSELHRAIVDLNNVLKEFEACYGKSKTRVEGQEKIARGGNALQNGCLDPGSERPPSAAKVASQGTKAKSSNAEMSAAIAQHRSQIRKLQMSGNIADGAEKEATSTISHNRKHANSRYQPDYETQTESAPTNFEPEQQVETQLNRRAQNEKCPDQRSTYNGTARGYTQEDNARRYYPYAQPGSSPQGSPHRGQEQLRLSQKANRTANPAPPEIQQHSGNDGLNELFEEDNEEEEEEEDDDNQESARNTIVKPDPGTQDTEQAANASQAIFLGDSKLGAPKQPTNSLGSAPLAPMMHNRKDPSGRERRTS